MTALWLCACLPLSAHATEWDVDLPHSSLTFKGEQSGEGFSGEFLRFSPAIDFDPKAPEKGSIIVEVDMASVVIEGDDRKEAITGADFFDVAKHATATFTSKKISVEKSGFVAEGVLALKGISKPMSLHFSLTEEGGVTTAKGHGWIERNQFNVGTGDYASNEWIAYPVAVHFTLKAKPKA